MVNTVNETETKPH